jgi:hypothetical protein
MSKRRSLKAPKYGKKEVQKGNLLSDLQRSSYDLNCPYLLIHTSYGGLTKLSIYS